MADSPAPADTTSETDAQAPDQPEAQPEIPAEVKAALRKANKEAEQLRLKLKQYEDRDKSEAEKLAERAAAAEAMISPLEQQNRRLRIAMAKGIPLEIAERLVGDTDEDMAADADRLLAVLTPVVPQGAGSADGGPRGTAALPLNGDPLLRALKEKLNIR